MRDIGESISGRVGYPWDVMNISIEAREEFVPADLSGGEVVLCFDVGEGSMVC